MSSEVETRAMNVSEGPVDKQPIWYLESWK